MEKEFFKLAGSILNRDKTPCFAIPVFVNESGKVVVQELKDGIICFKEVKKDIFNSERLILPMRKSFSKDFLEKNLIMTYAFERDLKYTGTYSEIEEYISENYKKYRKEFKNPIVLAEIIDFNSKKTSHYINNYELEK